MTNKLSINGRQIVITEAIRKYTEEKVEKLSKFNDAVFKTDITLSAAKLKTGKQHVCEILCYLSGKTIKSKANEDDLYYAIDNACDAMEVQLKKHKEKSLRSQNQEKITFNFSSAVEDPEEKKIIKVFLQNKPMDVSEAILQLEAMNRLFVTFINANTNKMAVVYKRKDGDYGLIED